MTVSSFQNGSFLSGTSGLSTYKTSGSIDYSSFYNEDYLENKYNYYETQQAFENVYAGRDAALKGKITNVGSYIAKGKEDKAMEAYAQLLEELMAQEAYSTLSETQLRAVARQMIEAELGGSLEDFIRENTKTNSAVQHQKIMTWGNCDETSQEDLLYLMCDIDEEEGNGNIIVGALATIASPFVVGFNYLFNGGKKM